MKKTAMERNRLSLLLREVHDKSLRNILQDVLFDGDDVFDAEVTHRPDVLKDGNFNRMKELHDKYKFKESYK